MQQPVSCWCNNAARWEDDDALVVQLSPAPHPLQTTSRSTRPLLCGSDRHCSCSSQLLALIALLIRALCTVMLLQRIKDSHTDNPVPLRRFTLMHTQTNHVCEPAPAPERDATSERARAQTQEQRTKLMRRHSRRRRSGAQAFRRSDRRGVVPGDRNLRLSFITSNNYSNAVAPPPPPPGLFLLAITMCYSQSGDDP
jgi:hypothetical protein